MEEATSTDSFANLTCNDARAKIRLNANSNIFETATETTRPVAHFKFSDRRLKVRYDVFLLPFQT